MFSSRRRSHIGFVVLLIAGLGLGCSSSGRAPESEKAVEGFQKTRAAIAKAQGEVERSNASLDQLTAGGDLQKSFKNYTVRVSDLEKSAQAARKRAEAMRARVEEYTDHWQKEIQTMQDPTIRAGLTERREVVRQNFQNVRESAQAARNAYEPYMAQLKEVQRALSIDLTPQNIEVMKPAIDKARQLGQTLKQKLAAMQSELDGMVKATSPAARAG